MKTLPFNSKPVSKENRYVDQFGEEWKPVTFDIRDTIYPYEFEHLKDSRKAWFTSKGLYQAEEQRRQPDDPHLSILLPDNDPSSPWRDCATDPPKKKDANLDGRVFGWHMTNGAQSAKIERVMAGNNGYTHWMPIPPLPRPAPNFQRDFLDKHKGTAAEELWNLLDDATKQEIETKWKEKRYE